MINGLHALIYAKDAEKARAFFRDVLKLRTIDAGHGWLLFTLPPAELGIHPSEGEVYHQFYLMCDDLKQTMVELKAKGVSCGAVHEAPWGSITEFEIPGGGKMGLYQPKHPTAIAKR